MLLQAMWYFLTSCLAGHPPPQLQTTAEFWGGRGTLESHPLALAFRHPELEAPSRDQKPLPLASEEAPLFILVLRVASIYPVLAVFWGMVLSTLCM